MSVASDRRRVLLTAAIGFLQIPPQTSALRALDESPRVDDEPDAAPAMEAGIADHVWSLEEIAGLA